MLALIILLPWALRAALRSRADLGAESLLLPDQLTVLGRPGRKRPPLRTRDKLLGVLARRLCPAWRRHLVLVRPDTVVRWHREAWKLVCRWKSRTRLGRPVLPTLLVRGRAGMVGHVLAGRRRTGMAGSARESARMGKVASIALVNLMLHGLAAC